MNGTTGSFSSLHPSPHFLSGTPASTGIAGSVVSGESLNASAAHGSRFSTTRSITRAITSCSGCEIGANAMQIVYWRPETTTGFSNASITAAPYTTVSDGYTLSVYPLHKLERIRTHCKQHFAFGLCNIHANEGRPRILQWPVVIRFQIPHGPTSRGL